MLVAIITGFVAFQHLAFGYLEMVLWNTPAGRKVFRTDPDFSAKSRALAANQGLYNLFLAAGLICSFFLAEPSAFLFRAFFLACVVTAGVFGGLTVNPRIFFLQAVPAIAGFIVLFI